MDEGVLDVVGELAALGLEPVGEGREGRVEGRVALEPGLGGGLDRLVGQALERGVVDEVEHPLGNVGGGENVSIHAPAWGATPEEIFKIMTDAEAFQFTLPRGERLEYPKLLTISDKCFNSRSRGGSDSK